jgi:hypothetical protein
LADSYLESVEWLVCSTSRKFHAHLGRFLQRGQATRAVAKLEAQVAPMPAAKLNVLWPATKN